MSRHPGYPFVRCLLAWEDPWGKPPKPSDQWHWCALAPGHDGDCECTCGAVRSRIRPPIRRLTAGSSTAAR